jgi:hypothetical protein
LTYMTLRDKVPNDLGATGDINGCLQQLLSQLSSDPALARLNDSHGGIGALLRVDGGSSRRAG